MCPCCTRGMILHRRTLGRVIAIAALLAEPQISAATELAGRISVIDGDTIEMHGQRIRLFGIDAPERGQSCYTEAGEAWRCGTSAARRFDELTADKTVRCTKRSTDRYGRIVAVCLAQDQDIGKTLVQEGMAIAYRKFSRDYVGAEKQARAECRGIWGGTFQEPEDWRKEH